MASGLTKKMKPSDELKAIIGNKRSLTRAEAVKAIWDYAKENDLKETKVVKGRNVAGIKPDDVLAEIFGSKKWQGMGDIAKAVSANLE